MLTVDANVWVAAFDASDRFHAESTTFLRAATRRGLMLNAPALLVVEAACALARRAGSAAVGEAARHRLRSHPTLAFLPLDDHLLNIAVEIGSRQLLRGADSLYAAAAAAMGSQLVSWDDDLVRRAGAVTPTAWLAANA